MQAQTNTDFSQGSVSSNIVRLAVPMTLAQLVNVLYNIIDAKRIFAMRDSDENTYDFDMIYLGRLTYQKDPQRLMRLSAALKARKPDIKVAVVGAGELEEETKALCRELDLQDNVHFLGFQSNPIKIVADSKAMILTSRWEGTPMCALEAMALAELDDPESPLLLFVKTGRTYLLAHCVTA